MNLYKIAQLSHQLKQNIPLFLDQRKRQNYADILTKFNVEKQTPALWFEYQLRLLQPQWLSKHPKFWEEQVLKESRERIGLLAADEFYK